MSMGARFCWCNRQLDGGARMTVYLNKEQHMGSSGLFGIFFVVVLGLIAFGIIQSILRQQQIGELRRSGTRAATVTNILHERVQTYAGAAPNPTTGAPAAPARYRDDWFVEATWRDPATGAAH